VYLARRIRPPPLTKWILLATWLVVVLYAFPGYMNWDSAEQLSAARHGRYHDFFPPFMSFEWHWIERLIRGPAGMLLLQTWLFVWGVYKVLATRLAPRAAAIAGAVVCLFPPVLTPMTVVWKDAQMAGYLMAGFALALQPRRWQRVLGVALLVMATAMRYNTPAAIAPLCLVVCGTWGFRRRLVAFGAAVALCLGIVGGAAALNALISTGHANPWVRTTAVWDIAGTLCRADRMSDAELDQLLAGTGHIATRDIQGKLCTVYTPRFYLDVTQGDDHFFTDPPTQSEVAARGQAWWRVVREHPGAYLGHRVNVMAEVLGLTDDRVWEPVCQTVNPNEARVAELHHDFKLSSVQYGLGRLFVRLGKTPVYRVWVYAVLALIFLGYALVRRDGFVLGVLGSGLLYELSLFVASPSVDFRYSHWMIACTCIAIAIVFVERYLSGTASSTRPPGDRPR
jgi:hypothetical protein